MFKLHIWVCDKKNFEQQNFVAFMVHFAVTMIDKLLNSKSTFRVSSMGRFSPMLGPELCCDLVPCAILSSLLAEFLF